MGDIADMILDGILDEWTGEYIGPGVGHPRSMDPDHWSNQKWRKPTAKDSINYGKNPLGGIEKWLKLNNISRTGRCVHRYAVQVLNKPFDITDRREMKRIAAIIQNHGWEAFTKWVKETYK